MESKEKIQVSLLLDKDLVEAADKIMTERGYRSRDQFYSMLLNEALEGASANTHRSTFSQNLSKTMESRKEEARQARLKAMMLEKRCFQMFQAMGWSTEKHMSITLPGNNGFRPDITLSVNDQIMGCVEVRTDYGSERSDIMKIYMRTSFILNEFKPTVFIFTNGYIFDLYLEGEYFDQLTFVPSPDDIALLLKSKKGGC